MFRHKGKKRTLKHNIRIASVLSFVAGIVNVAGFLAVQRLTTNVTGHFAYLIDEVLLMRWGEGMIYFLYIFSFFIGSFASNVLVEFASRTNAAFSHRVPVVIEAFILAGVALFGSLLIEQGPHLMACILLFSMGMQNSLVTTISNATVRTTHLTGLFTDLGIELAQLLFYVKPEERAQLTASIKLRLIIISFFFLGGILGGILYIPLGLYSLFVAAAALLAAVIYDTMRMQLIVMERKIRNR